MNALVRLYPRAWRERYGDEFAAVLEDEALSPFDVVDLVLGALDAHLHPQVHRTETSNERRLLMRTSSLNRMSGAALVLAGFVWIVSALAMNALSDGDALKTFGFITTFVAVPTLLLVGFCGIWLHARRTARSSRIGEAAYSAAVFGSIVIACTAFNLVLHDSEPAWTGFIVGIVLFFAGLGISAVAITVSGTLPQWSTLPLMVVGSIGVVVWIAGPPALKLIAFPESLFVVLAVALGGGLILLGSALYTIRRDHVLAHTIGPRATV
ncbi:MAG: hypothetical protein NVS2B16_16860 [Chloroflexota bacterium]